jgi:hypothetical protein
MDNPAQQQYFTDIKRFPELPEEIKDESLYFLKLQIMDQPLNSQRNFFAYLLMYGGPEIYDRFLDMWREDDEEDLERISPSC